MVRFSSLENDNDQQSESSKNESFINTKLIGSDCGGTGRLLVQRLFIAHTIGEYLSPQTKVLISINGKRTTFQVIRGEEVSDPSCTTAAMSTTNHDTLDDSIIDDLVKGIDEMSLQTYNRLQRLLIDALVNMNSIDREALILYKISYTTKIVFIDGETIGEEGYETSNHQRKQTEQQQVPQDNFEPLVAGLDSILKQVQSALETPLLHPELFYGSSTNHGLRPPKGILLHGPGGVGKSSIALQVGLSFELRGMYHVERIHCTALQSQTAFVGQAERRLVQIFKEARKPRSAKKGCLLILDDIHLICPRRQGTDLGSDRLASTLLALLDGLETESTPRNNFDGADVAYPVVILAVTTNPGALDAALRRPGRLDSEIEVPLPDEPKTRSDILKFQIRSLGATTELTENDWLSLARLAKGFTGADLKLASKEALRISFLTGDNTKVSFETMKKAIRSIKPSAIKAVTVEVPRVPWSSIGGMDAVKSQLREAIELPLIHGMTFQKLGIRPPRGVLLFGPPGCSKTLMARAIATDGNMNFLAVKGPELLSKWLGESERALAALFRRARLASPAVIFFDEVDAIASKRGGSSSGGSERLLSQLLTELDGIQSDGDGSGEKGRVVIICATNRPDLLDGALMRPGRIDRMIYVGIPDESSRKRILEIGLNGKSCSDDVDVSALHNMFVSFIDSPILASSSQLFHYF